jgi:hypothetical protein
MNDSELLEAIRGYKPKARPRTVFKRMSTMMIFALLCSGVIAAAGGYQIFNAIATFAVAEAVDVYYASDNQMASANWTKIAPGTIGGTLNLPSKDLKAGESDAVYLLLNNTANAGTLGLAIDMQNIPDTLTTELICDTGSGMKWVKDNSTFYVKLPSQTNYRIGLNTTAAGDIAEGNITVDNIFLRSNPLSDGDYTNTC